MSQRAGAFEFRTEIEQAIAVLEKRRRSPKRLAVLKQTCPALEAQ
jgi:hypothetical protein